MKKNLLLIYLLSIILTSCISQYNIVSNEDLKVKLTGDEENLHIKVENISSDEIVIGIQDSILPDITPTEIQIGEYSYLETFLTKFKLVKKGQSHKLVIDNPNVADYKIKLIYANAKKSNLSEDIFVESTTMLFPNGKFFILEINSDSVSSATKSIY